MLVFRPHLDGAPIPSIGAAAVASITQKQHTEAARDFSREILIDQSFSVSGLAEWLVRRGAER
jgi:hypothetical protein